MVVVFPDFMARRLARHDVAKMQLILSPCDSQRFNPFELFEHQPHVRRKSALAGKERLMPLAPKRRAFVAFALFGRHLGGHRS